MKRYRVDFGYGRYYFEPNDEGDWVRYQDAQSWGAKKVQDLVDERESLQAQLEQIRQAKLTWGMACDCVCVGCLRFEREVNSALGTLCPHGMPLAENICGPCSKGEPNQPPKVQP